jgi:hypothetical protein
MPRFRIVHVPKRCNFCGTCTSVVEAANVRGAPAICPSCNGNVTALLEASLRHMPKEEIMLKDIKPAS